MAARTSRSSAPVGATRPGGPRGLTRAGAAPGARDAPEHRAGDVAGGRAAGSAGRTRQRAPDPRGRPRRLVLALARCPGPEPRPHAPLGAADPPGFSLAAVGVLALGTGGTTAVFTLIDSVMLRPLPVSDPARLYRIGDGDDTVATGAATGRWGLFSHPLYRAIEGRERRSSWTSRRSTGAARC